MNATQTTLSLPTLETVRENAYPAERHNVWSHNDKKKDIVREMFKEIMIWAGENCGYGDDTEEKQATGLGGLMYLDHIEPAWAIRFAAEVCEQHNYHGECAGLMNLYESVTQPYQNSRNDNQSVNWWAD